MSTIEVKVPDIGDFTDVPVIEVLVKPGDTVKAEDSLVTLESDKATMDVPAPAAGVVKSLGVKVGDKVSEGALLLTLETTAAEAPAARPAATGSAPAAPAAPAAAKPPPAPPRAPAATAATRGADEYRGAVDIECQMVVIGSGPGGYSGAFRAADLGLKTVLIERYSTLGGVCLNVGCIPSKALLHAAKVIDEAEEMSHFGVTFGKPAIDLAKLRGWKESVVRKLTGGLSGLAKQRKVSVVTGVARFVDAHHLEVSAGGKKQVVKFEHCIIAAGSQAVKLPFVPDDPRVIDSTGALELEGLPGHMLVIGGGIIGMEMAQVYSALGAKITVVEMLSQLMTGADPDLVRPFARRMEKRYEKIMLKTRVTKVEAQKDGLKVWFEGEQAPAAPQIYDRVLVAVGRSPERKKNRRRACRRRRRRARIHPRRRPDADQRRAYLRDRRHRQAADAGAQGGARGARRRRGCGRREILVRRPRDSIGRVHRSRARLGRRHRRGGQGAGHQVRQGDVSLGGQRPLAFARPR